MSILVLNAGSSTLKFAVFDQSTCDELASGIAIPGEPSGTTVLRLQYDDLQQTETVASIAGYPDAFAWILGRLKPLLDDDPIQAVGHRVVHGGTEFSQATIVDENVCETILRLSRLAPLHNPLALSLIEAAKSMVPSAEQVAVFDTSFFTQLPKWAWLYPLPYDWYERYGIRRFGFHGISHAYCADRVADLLGRQDDPSLRLVICHLGNGCSATAVRGGRPVSTTMGFTPLEGLMMGTRSGSVDPGALMHLIQHEGLTATQVEDALNRQSGLLGVSGASSDFREVERAAASGDERATLAITMFTDRIRSTIGAMAVTLGGIDGLVFTAGIGEHSATLRSRVCYGLECIGLQLLDAHNKTNQCDRDIANGESTGSIFIVRSREEAAIAGEVKRLLSQPGNHGSF